MVALRSKTPTNTAHYVRLPSLAVRVSDAIERLSEHIQFNVSEEMIDAIATDKTDTLLCPKFWESRSR